MLPQEDNIERVHSPPCPCIWDYTVRIRTQLGIYGKILPFACSLGLCPQERPQAKGYIQSYIPRPVLIRIQYKAFGPRYSLMRGDERRGEERRGEEMKGEERRKEEKRGEERRGGEYWVDRRQETQNSALGCRQAKKHTVRYRAIH